MSKIAFVYPGQGAQKAGMGKDFYEQCPKAKELFDQAGKWLNLDMKALCFEENDRLDVTEYTQAALVTTCLAMTRVAEEAGLAPDVTAGLSLGEYAAIAVAGGMSEEDAIRLVRKRGILMQEAYPAGVGAMAAVLGMDAETIEKTIEPIADVTIDNYNCPGQIVITGLKEAVEQAAESLKAAGAKRVLMLNVSGPFHSPLLKEAGAELGKVLAETEVSALQIPYVTNVTAREVTDIQQTKALLEQQVASPVRWEQSMRYLIDQGVDTFVEIGPGRTLAGFMRKISRDVNMYNIAAVEDVAKVISAIQGE